eukprot:TRINITY_DN7068_c0_g4_i1.p1 TRINITY_DN7068_c0_g4~~TRINITY_DN7068_c0_g4_i1.p1  ORF type:complete len:1542 (+),score=475.62 TRINITY_DN7068_c0_g4_i1:137-4762(+)
MGIRDLGPGTLVWVPAQDTSKAAFLPATVRQLHDDSTVTIDVLCEVGTKGSSRVSRNDLRLRFSRDDGATSPDSTSLVHMNDASILDNMRRRHKNDEIYTYTANVLLAVNPFKTIDGLYGEEQCRRYKGRHIGALPPHPYAISDTAYRLLNREKKNQALLISGESGAGKTETAKIVMEYLAFVSGTGSDLAMEISGHLLRSQPILESFGNAATLRNNNSSRFGKYSRVFFDDSCALADASITTYLLESARVVTHAERERTYHIFYEVLNGLDESKLREFDLVRDAPYRLLHSAGQKVAGFEDLDLRNFKRLCNALQNVGFNEEAMHQQFQVIAGLIHLGDVAFEDEHGVPRLEATPEDEDSVPVAINSSSVASAARLLGFDADELASVLKYKKIQIRGRTSVHEVARTPMQFRQALHSFIKALYKRMFEGIVSRMNKTFSEMKSPNSQSSDPEDLWRHIGILDIYGFERLERNSFEQLCINLANERLQQCFVENVLLAEQDVYRREAIPWTDLLVPDSQPVVKCIAQIFTSLDDFSGRLAKGLEKDATDERFCTAVVEDATKDPERRDLLKKPLVTSKNRRVTSGGLGANESFTIRHYAGVVEYATAGWLDKNNDRLLQECEDLVVDSSNAVVSSLADEEKETRGSSRSPFRSISKKYQQDLGTLLNTLGTCNLHYIRCFKPNEAQKPNKFQEQMVLDQIVQCGTIELVKIMHDGYPNRCPFSEINERFRSMLPEKFQRYGTRTFIEALMLAYEVPREQWALGMSRLFLKAGQLKALEDMRSEGSPPSAEVLEKIVSGIVRKRWLRAGHAVMFCNYVPKVIAKMQAVRAAQALSRAALIVGRLAPKLEAAKQRVAERRMKARRRVVAAFKTVRLLNAFKVAIREQRLDRLAKIFQRSAFIFSRSRRWIAIGRERALEAANQRAAELRRLEDERKRMEAQRLKMEEDRKQEELRRREEEARRAEEMAARRAEEDKLRQEEERRREASESRRREESLREREEVAAQRAAEVARMEEERAHLEAERKRLEEERAEADARCESEKQERLEAIAKYEAETKMRVEAIAKWEAEKQEREREQQERQRVEAEKEEKLAQKEAEQAEMEEQLARVQADAARLQEQLAEAARGKEQREAEEAAKWKALELREQELEKQRSELVLAQATPQGPKRSSNARRYSQGRSEVDEDEITPMDSVSSAPQKPNEEALQRRTQELEQSHADLERQLQDQRLKMQRLQQQLEEKNTTQERERRNIVGECSPLSLPPEGEEYNFAAMSPVHERLKVSPLAVTPEEDRYTSETKRGPRMSKGARRYSLVGDACGLGAPTNLSRRMSCAVGSGQRQARPSVAPEALKSLESPSGTYTDKDSKVNRRWWGEQKQQLMQDLNFSIEFSPASQRSRRRSTLVGLASSGGSAAKSSTAPALQAAPVRDLTDKFAMVSAGSSAIATASTVASSAQEDQSVSISTADLKRVDDRPVLDVDTNLDSAAYPVAGSGGESPSQAAAVSPSAGKNQAAGPSKMKQPKVYWHKRNSVGASSGSSPNGSEARA